MKNFKALILKTLMVIISILIMINIAIIHPLYDNSNPKIAESEVIQWDISDWKNKSEKVILLWTGFFFKKWEQAVNQNLARSVHRCVATDDKTQIKHADAVLFHSMDLYFWNTFPTYRHVNQTWVWYNMEAPPMQHYRDFRSYKNLFNWTMSYRTDSTIFSPYGDVRQLDPQLDQEIIRQNSQRNYAREKTKLALAIVGNCYDHGNRYQIIHQLSKYMQIDFFGRCGNLVCPRENPINCSARPYKFKLSLENAICDDYASEKFWMAVQEETLPIVYWSRHIRNVPVNSYINIKDFPSIKSLAEYLMVLDKNDTLYNQYFEWKTKYTFSYINVFYAFSKLCDHLHRPIPSQTIRNPLKWLKNDSCQRWTITGRANAYMKRTLFELGLTQ